LRREKTRLAAARRHADVDERDVRPTLLHHAQQLIGVAASASDLKAGVCQQTRKALAQQCLVVCDHEAHGSSACRICRSAATVPPTAPIRSATRTGNVPKPDAAHNSTSKRPSRRWASTATSPDDAMRSDWSTR